MTTKNESEIKTVSTRNDIYSIIRDRIALLEYEPEEVIKEDQLVEEFECSRTPIRTAFTLLEQEGLIKRVPKSGTYVTPVSFQSIREIFRIRKHLLDLVAELVVKNINTGQLNNLESLAKKMAKEEEPSRLIEMDLDFHRKIYKAMGSYLLEKIMRSIIVKATRIWLFTVDQTISAKFSEDFFRLINALEEENEAKVRKILVNHSQRTIKYVRKELGSI